MVDDDDDYHPDSGVESGGEMMDVEDEQQEEINPFIVEGGGYERKLQDLLGIFGGLLAVDSGYDPNLSNDELDEKYHKVFHDLILSCLRSDAGFLKATCYDIYNRSMKKAMEALTTEIEETFKAGEDDKNLMLSQLWCDAAIVGDGSITASYPKRGKYRVPRQSIAIKDKCNGNIHVKNFLLHPNQSRLGWRLTKSKKYPGLSTGVNRQMNERLMTETPVALTSPLMLSFKKLNYMLICALSSWARVFTDDFVPHNIRSEIVFKAQATMVSWLNSLHGTTLPLSFYRKDFQKLVNDKNVPFLLDMALGGIIGTDGTVGFERSRVFRIYQANRMYCEGLADAVSTRYGVGPKVAPRTCKTLREKQRFEIKFKTKDSEKLLLRVGSFDLIRPDQHVVLMLRALVVKGSKNSPMQNSSKLNALLGKLTSYIKKVRPS